MALRTAAKTAALGSKFSPSLRDGEATASTIWVTFDFPATKSNSDFFFSPAEGKDGKNYSAVTTNADYKGPVDVNGTESSSDESDRRSPPKTLSGGILNGKATDLPRPSYPAAARAVKASGSVPVQVLIHENGEVFMAQAVDGHPLLRSNAISAACGAKFMPTLLSGKPVKVVGIINYNFVP